LDCFGFFEFGRCFIRSKILTTTPAQKKKRGVRGKKNKSRQINWKPHGTLGTMPRRFPNQITDVMEYISPWWQICPDY